MTDIDWDRILFAIKGSRNTLAGWLRDMEDYDDEAMKRALAAAYDRPDPRIRTLHIYRAMVAELERELGDQSDSGEDRGHNVEVDLKV